MSYVASTTTNRQLGTLGVVALLHVGIGYALVTGLAATIVRHFDPPLVTTDVPPLPKPTVSPSPPPVDRRDTRPIAPRPTPLDPFDLGPTPLPSFPADTGDSGIGDAVFPTPTPTGEATRVPPAFAALAARPRGNPAQWVTTNDYPTAALRMEQEGLVRVRLAVSAEGRATGCEVTASSGFAELDQATCDKLVRRARFTPASDESGAKVSGNWATSVRWAIPD